MTKIFCDCCGQEITEKNKNICISFKEKFEVYCNTDQYMKRYGRQVRHEEDNYDENIQLQAADNQHICLYCIIDAYKSVDNRPIKATIPAQL